MLIHYGQYKYPLYINAHHQLYISDDVHDILRAILASNTLISEFVHVRTERMCL